MRRTKNFANPDDWGLAKANLGGHRCNSALLFPSNSIELGFREDEYHEGEEFPVVMLFRSSIGLEMVWSVSKPSPVPRIVTLP